MRRPSLRAPELLRTALAAVLVASLVALPARAGASISMEREVGAEFVKEARRGLPMIHDWEINRLITEIGRRYVAVLGSQPFDYEFFVVSEDSINAFAVPGGKIFVHAGLIARAESEDELAGVIGHEVAHANAHHSVRQQEKAAAANYASLLGVFLSILNPVLGQAAIAAAMGQQLKYQRDFEREADFLGLEYSQKAGIDPAAMLRLLRKIYDEQKINPTMIPPYFQSHPLSGERMAYLEAALRKTEWESAKPVKSWRLERADAIARAHAQTRREAVPPYERRLSLASEADKPAALELIGIMMVHGEEYDTGKKYLEQADAAGRTVDRELGRAYLRTGKLDEAKVRLTRHLKTAPDDYDAHADLGDVCYQQGAYTDAVTHLQKSVDLYPYIPKVEQSLARALDKAGKTGAGFYYLGHAAEFQGDRNSALGYYQKALERLSTGDPLHAKAKKQIETLEKEKPRLPMPPRPRPPGP